MSSLVSSLLAVKQKRGPGFKYASNLPGSLLKDSRLNRDVKEESDLPSVPTSPTVVKRKAERDDTPKRKAEEYPPLKKRSPMLSLGGLPHPRPRPEDNPLRKKRKLFDIKDEDEPPVVKKKVIYPTD